MQSFIEVENLAKLIAGLAAFSPGFLVTHFRNSFITGRQLKISDIFLQLLIVSAVYYSSIGLLFISFGWTNPFALFMLFFGVPTVLGVGLGWLYQREFFERIYEFLHLNPVHPASTAWDYVFGAMKQPKWVVVTMKDGRQIRGWYTKDSGASSDLSHRDFYVDDVRNESFERIEKDKRKRGLWIHEDEISTIEFISE